jgi:hypothetical protein
MPSIGMPLPSPGHVERFRKIVRETRGVELADRDAYEQCAALVRYVYLSHYVLPAVREAKRPRR